MLYMLQHSSIINNNKAARIILYLSLLSLLDRYYFARFFQIPGFLEKVGLKITLYSIFKLTY